MPRLCSLDEERASGGDCDVAALRGDVVGADIADRRDGGLAAGGHVNITACRDGDIAGDVARAACAVAVADLGGRA